MAAIVFSTYSRIFDLWANSAIRRETTTEDYQKIFTSFAEFVRGKELASVSRLDVLGFRDHLVAQGQRPATIARKISVLKTLFRVAREYESISSNPADQVRVMQTSRQKSRVAFSLHDLARIFNSPIYIGGYRPAAGGKEACYWLPLLALFTGARVEELAQLLVDDVRSVEGLGWYLNISDEAVHSKLKNAASRRRIPLHRTLIDCGFLDYVQTMRGGHLLFPALKPNPRQKLGGYFSTFFSVYLRKRLRITDRRKVFHSFRHTFKDLCRRTGIDEAVHDALTGHTAPHAGRRYGNELYPLEPLFEAIEQFEIQGLDLSHLYTRPPSQRIPKPDPQMVSAYYGIIIAFCRTRGNPPVLPNLHARCQGAEALFSIHDSAFVCGDLPAGKQLLVRAWIEIHREELIANWENWKVSGNFFRIDPLR